MKKCISFLMVVSLVSNILCVRAEKRLVSPDKRIVVIMDDKKGQLTYEVCRDGKTFIRCSSLGLTTNSENLTDGLTISSCQISDINDTYTLNTWKQSRINLCFSSALILHWKI